MSEEVRDDRASERSTCEQEENHKVKPFVCCLIVLFAMSSWISVNGLFVELPLFVQHLPEGWQLPSYLCVVVTAANIGILLWAFLRRIARPNEVIAVYVLFAIGTVATGLCSFFWNSTAWVNGTEHSVGLLVLCGVDALVDCMSNVVFLPFVARFHASGYVAGYYMGSWAGGLVPGILGLMQGVGGEPRCVNVTTGNESNHLVPEYPAPTFSVGVFCALLCGMIVMSIVSFTCLLVLPVSQQEMSNPDGYERLDSSHSDIQIEAPLANARPLTETQELLVDSSVVSQVPQLRSGRDNFSIPANETVVPGNAVASSEETRRHYATLLALSAWASVFIYGFLPSIESYAALPYGNVTFTLAVRLPSIAGPIACLIALFWSTQSVPKLVAIVAAGTACGCYHIVLAVQSPSPMLQHEDLGSVLVILTAVLFSGLLAYSRVSMATTLRIIGGADGLFWCGAITQVGSTLGSIIAFILVVENLFVSKPAC